MYVVGDTPADVRSAQEVGIPVIALATGIFGYEELLSLGPDACFPCGTDLLSSRG
jgi:phosphoglycolate phosphatase-like HAD superfamily hydrolase